MQLKKRIVTGVRWTALSSILTVVLHFTKTVMLARILSPDDFGLMSMIMVVLGFVQAYSDMGISNAIVHRQNTTMEQLSSLYWLNIFAGIVVFMLLIMLTPFVVWFYNEPRLAELIHYAALLFLITPLGQQFQILLKKELQFITLSIIEVIAGLTGTVVAVSSAFMGQGVFSILWGILGAILIKTIILFIIGWKRWRPMLRFQFIEIKSYLSFGLYQMGEKSINYFNQRLDQLIIGVLVGTQALGYYNLAYNLVVLPITRINPIVGNIAFPVFAKIQLESEKLKHGFFEVIKFLSLINFPLLFGIAVVAPFLVPLVFGEQWLPAIGTIQILSFVVLLRSNGNPVGSLLLAKGRADLGFKWNAILLITQIPGIYCGARLGGVTGVAIALLFLQIIYSIFNYLVLIRTLLGPCLKEYFMSIAPAFGLSFFMALIVAVIPAFMIKSSEIIVALQIMTGILVYLILNIIFRRNQLQKIISLIMGR